MKRTDQQNGPMPKRKGPGQGGFAKKQPTNKVPPTTSQGITAEEVPRRNQAANALTGPCPWCSRFTPFHGSDLIVHVMLNHVPNRQGLLYCRYCDQAECFESAMVAHLEAKHPRGAWKAAELNSLECHFVAARNSRKVRDCLLNAETGKVVRADFLSANLNQAIRKIERYRGASADIHCPPVYTQEPPEDADGEISSWLTKVLVLGLGDMHADAPPVVQDFIMKRLGDIMNGLKESVCRELWGNERYEEYERTEEMKLFASAPTTPAQPPSVSSAGPQTPSAHLARELQGMEIYGNPVQFNQQQQAAGAAVAAGGMGLAPMLQQRMVAGELTMPPNAVPVYVQGPYQPYVDGVEPLPQRQPQQQDGGAPAVNAAAAAAQGASVNGHPPPQQMDCASPGPAQTV